MKPLAPIIAFLSATLLAGAHEVRPAYLELTERSPGEFEVFWKVPALGGVPLAGEDMPHDQPIPAVEARGLPRTLPCGCPAPTAAQLARGVLAIHPVLPSDAQTLVPPRIERLPGAEVRRWAIRAGARGLEGWEARVHGLKATMVDVLVRIEFVDGRVVSRLLRPDAPSFTFTGASAGPAAGGFFKLGVEHILTGVDHLLFVLALVIITLGAGRWSNGVVECCNGKPASVPTLQHSNTPTLHYSSTPISRLLLTVTAFTVAHSITLALTTLGVVTVPSAPVEAVIALSIVFVAAEIVRARHGQRGLTERVPWLVAGSFGLLHGFGFAGALAEVGLPQNAIPLALLLFNVGVEAGQLAFVAVVLAGLALTRRLSLTLPRWAPLVPPYAIGSVAMFWVVQRVAAL